MGEEEAHAEEISVPNVKWLMKINKLSGSQCYAEGSIYFLHFYIRECTDIIGEQGFMNTDQIVTVNSAVVFEPFIHANFNLGLEASVIGVNRSANYGGETVINKGLSGDDEENPVFLWIIFGTPINPVEVTALHS